MQTANFDWYSAFSTSTLHTQLLAYILIFKFSDKNNKLYN